MRRKIIFFLIIAISPLLVIGQTCFNMPINIGQQLLQKDNCSSDTIKHKKKKPMNGLSIGANLGFYFANAYTAQYYNGSGIHGSGNVDSTIFKSPYNYPQLKQAFNGDSFNLAALPGKMRYSPSFYLGVYLKYTYKNSGFFMQFGYTKLTTTDVFTIDIVNPIILPPDSAVAESIWGSEERTTIDLGYSYTFCPNSKFRPFVQFGANLTDTKFVTNQISIAGFQYSISNWYDAYYKINQGGVGYGAFVGGGIDMVFSDMISVMPTCNIYYTHAKMGYLTQPKFNYTFNLTVVFKGII